jgi:putative redox protein
MRFKRQHSVTLSHLKGLFAMECTINWQPTSGMAFMAETGSGHIINMDGAPDGGGRNLAPRPMETVLAGTGGCTAYDVVLILKRGRHDVRGCQLKLTADRADTDPKVFTKINMHFVVTGVNLTDTAVARAIQMSHEKYCISRRLSSPSGCPACGQGRAA